MGQFLAHGYSVGVAVSYTWDFLVCIIFCAKIAVSKNSKPALRTKTISSNRFLSEFSCHNQKQLQSVLSRVFICNFMIDLIYVIRIS